MRRTTSPHSLSGRARPGTLRWRWLLPVVLLAACASPLEPPRIESFSASPTALADGETTEVTLTWQVTNAASLQLTSSGGLSLDVTGEYRHLLEVSRATTFTLTARNTAGTVSKSLEVRAGSPEDPGPDEPPDEPPPDEPPDEPPPDEPPPDEPPDEEPGGEAPDRILILVAGQSNAAGEGAPFPEGKEVADDGVYMLSQGPAQADWQWVTAAEPSHTYPNPEAHSFVVRLGNELKRATGRDVYLVPAAVGGSAMRHWLPGNGSGYFDTAFARARFAAADLGVPVSAVAWFQGESDSRYADQRALFAGRTETVFEAFHDGLPGAPPVLFVQLAKRLYDETDEERNVHYQVIRELQRDMEHGAVHADIVEPGADPGAAGDAPAYYRMVVSHDLAMSDDRHVGSEGQKTLGSRLAHAFLIDFWNAEGARSPERRGPRLLRIERAEPRALRVVVSRPVNDSATYDGYFGVFVDGAPVQLAAVGRDPADERSILLAASQALPDDLARVAVRYMPPDDVGLFATSGEAVHAVDAETGLRLPLPAFGSPIVSAPSSHLPLD